MNSKTSATHAAVPLRGEWCSTVCVREGHKSGQNVACSLERHTNKKGMRIFSFIMGKIICLKYAQGKKKAAVTSTTSIM